MTKTEIEFLRAAGFSIAEIMAMQPVGDQSADPAQADQPAPAAAEQTAPETAPATDPAPTQQAPAPAAAGAPAAQPADNNPEMTALLKQILAAVQAGNRSGAQMATPEKLTPEEIAGKLY